VASRWLVNDQSTALLMDKFYLGLKDGLPKAEALRQAKLQLIESEDFHHPFFWGSFTLIGSWL
jgi:CHAT domain-containing protein